VLIRPGLIRPGLIRPGLITSVPTPSTSVERVET
jgi:hypothetical protein